MMREWTCNEPGSWSLRRNPSRLHSIEHLMFRLIFSKRSRMFARREQTGFSHLVESRSVCKAWKRSVGWYEQQADGSPSWLVEESESTTSLRSSNEPESTRFMRGSLQP